MPYALDVAGGESAGKHAREREKREPKVEEEGDGGPRVHLSATESTVLSGMTSEFFSNLEVYSNFTVTNSRNLP